MTTKVQARTGRRATAAAPYFFVTPFVVPFVLVFLVPIAYAVVQSFQKTARADGLFGAPTTVFAGFDQYARAFSDQAFVQSVGRVLLFTAVQVPVMIVLALLVALLLDSQSARLKSLHRLATFAPYGIPGVIAALMWGFLYDPRLSPIVQLLQGVGLDPGFLTADRVLWSIANIVTWTYAGYNMIVLLAALQSIPADLIEAAAIDGAGPIRTAFQVKIPMIGGSLVLTTVFSLIGTMQLFTEPLVLRTITTNITSTYTPTIAAYSSASANDYSYAAAQSVLIALASFVLSFGFLALVSRRRAS